MSTTVPAPDPSRRELSEQQFGRLIIGSLVVAFVILGLMVGTAGWLLLRARDYTYWVDHTYAVESQLLEFRLSFERAEGARRAYLLGGGKSYRGTYGQTVPTLLPTLQRIRGLTGDNPRQQQTLDRLEPMLREKVALFQQSLAARDAGGLQAGLAAFQRPREALLLAEIRKLGADMVDEERRLLSLRSARQTQNAGLLLGLMAPSGVLLGLIAGGSTLVMRRYARDLGRSRDALRAMNAGLEDAVRERTADLTRANAEIQRFAYIVSHDLRAPLVNVMGFTSELEVASKPLRKLVEAADAEAPQIVTPEARAAVEADLPESIGFIRASTQKMDRLIAAILKLSREGRRTLNPERVATGPLVEGILKSLHSQIETRGADVAIEGDLPEIVTDRLAFEQIVSNLVENALKYLQPGRPGRVRVRGRIGSAGAKAVFEVVDNGRGIDPKDHERVFELFRRAGAQDQPGEGIGLAHVRALAYRMGGTVDVQSALDQGATFRLILPRILTREGID